MIGCILDLQFFSQRGIPAAKRPKIWALILQPPLAVMKHVCIALWKNILENEYITDQILENDLQYCQNDSYFLFEEKLFKILLYWSRDPWYRKIMLIQPIQPISKDIQPPNGIYPPKGISLYAMPLCYLFENEQNAYFIFRELYSK